MMGKRSNFYSKLPVQNASISDLLSKKENFASVPDDWFVLVADIKDSTTAVNNGKHNDVNLVATGCVIAILNLAEASKIKIPFFFGGDGASFIIPEELKNSALSVLEKHNRKVQKNFGFQLSIGTFQVSRLYADNVQLDIARIKISEALIIPIILGQGLQIAENYIKSNSAEITLDDTPLDLDGMECKWDKISPLDEKHEVLSLIISGCGDADFSRVYSKIMDKVDTIYGSSGKRKPISVKRLKIKTSLQRINREMKAKLAGWQFPDFLKNFAIRAFGEFYLRNTKNGKYYLQKLVELSDNLTLDGRINTVITGSPAQREKLFKYLDKLEDLKLIKYGYHISKESIMSCYVKNMKTNDHIHFVDGGDGGYTKAANLLKTKFANRLP